MLLRAAAAEYGWKLNYGGIALMWRGGCIIRSQFLGKIKEAFDKRKRLPNLLLDPHFKREIRKSQRGWRNVVATAAKKGIPAPAFSTALSFFDAFRSERLPANLLQAQRDYFGAHTYEGDEVSRAVRAALAARDSAKHVAVATGRASGAGGAISGAAPPQFFVLM